MKTQTMILLCLGLLATSQQGCFSSWATHGGGGFLGDAPGGSPGHPTGESVLLDAATSPLQAVMLAASIPHSISKNLEERNAAQRQLKLEQMAAAIKANHQVALDTCANWKSGSLELDAVLATLQDPDAPYVLKGVWVDYSEKELFTMFEKCPPARGVILGRHRSWTEDQLAQLYRLFQSSPPTGEADKSVLSVLSWNLQAPDWVLDEIASGKAKTTTERYVMERAALSLAWRKTMSETLAAINADRSVAIKGGARWQRNSPQVEALARSLADASISYTDADLMAIYTKCEWVGAEIVRYRAPTSQSVEKYYRALLRADGRINAIGSDRNLMVFVEIRLTPDWILKNMTERGHVEVSDYIRWAAKKELERRAAAKP